MLDSIYHMTLKLFCQHIFGMKTLTSCQYTGYCYEHYFIMLPKSINHQWFINFNT